MFELARYDAEKRVRGAAVLSGGIVALVAMYAWIWPNIESSTVDFDQYIEAFPPALREMFGIRSLGTIEGYLATELYAFVWVLLLGLYFAYAGAGLVASDVERGRMDVLLAMPVSRARVVTEKLLALAVPLLAVNVVTPAAVYVSVVALGESIAVADLVAVHALSVPYLLACAGIGLLASVGASRVSVAQRAAMGVVFGLFLVESVAASTDYSWLGTLSPSRYYEPANVLVDSQYDVGGALALLAGAVALFLAGVWWFRRSDVA